MTTTADKRFGCRHPATVGWAVDTLTHAAEDGLLQSIRARAAAAGMPDIHVSATDGRHLQVLAAVAGARKAVEVGTLAGYSGVCLLRGMGPTAFLHTLELSPVHARVAQQTFEDAGLANQVRVHVGAAEATLQNLAAQGPFDLVFLDADKPGYPNYLAWASQNLRVGGTVIADNVFVWDNIGAADADLAPAARVEAQRMRAFNQRLVASRHFMGTLLPTGEGLAVGVRTA